MTQIFSLASLAATMQVADRLVSRQAKPVDEQSNKTVIIMARDGMVSCSYTGLAFLGDDPIHTDTWVVETLTGKPYPRGPEDGWGLSTGPIPPDWPTVAETLDRLQASFQSAIRGLSWNSRAFPFELAMSGWIEREGNAPLALVCGFIKARGAADSQKYWHEVEPGKELLLSSAPEDNERYCHALADIEAKIKAVAAGGRVPPDAWMQTCLDVLVDEVQHVHRQIPGLVGPDCMTVLIPHLSRLEVTIRFRSLVTATAQLVDSRGQPVSHGVPAFYSPWIIGPGISMAPSLSIGSGNWNLGGIKFTIEGPPSALPGLVFATSHQRRKIEP